MVFVARKKKKKKKKEKKKKSTFVAKICGWIKILWHSFRNNLDGLILFFQKYLQK